jgi:hypothetical protein
MRSSLTLAALLLSPACAAALEPDRRDHWAFRPPVRPIVPQVRNQQSPIRNPIDAFLAARYEQLGLTPAGSADRGTLLRRVTLDLTGLPPTRDELRAFLADESPDAYERVVDRLLASPRHAERWARHWMDVWRYTDWFGSRHIDELRYSRRHIWRWRDWIIESLEKDRGYDQLVVEMLAADEAAPGDLDAQRASGYLGRNFYVFNRNVWLQETVDYTATAFLGLTLKCARCHDHKYDPISQEDYYRFRAVFEPHRVRTDPLPGRTEKLKGNMAMGSPPGSDLKEGLDCIYDADASAPTYLFARGNEKDPVKDRVIAPGVPAFLGTLRIEPVRLPVEEFYPSLRPAMRDHLLGEARTGVEKAVADAAKTDSLLTKAQVAAARARLVSLQGRIAAEQAKYTRPDNPGPAALAIAAGRAEREAAVRQAELDVLLARSLTTPDAANKVADAAAKLDRARADAAAPTGAYTPLGPVYPATSTGRRLALARWITSRDNPLTARVAVNLVWLRHFGSALVPSVHNFGRNGKPPTHPELLDWLAVEFMDHGWSLKHLHRLIVTSNAYRMASDNPQSASRNPQSADPENRSLWRANVRRMEAEVVRDSLLALSGRLDVTRGGPDLDPTTDAINPRRSLYFRHTPDEKPLILEVFDAANPAECYERTESIVPQQALALANGAFTRSQARLLARRIADADFVGGAFEMLLSRPPDSAERARCEAFLKTQAQLLAAAQGLTPAEGVGATAVPPSADPMVRAREDLVHVLLSYNEYVTIR